MAALKDYDYFLADPEEVTEPREEGIVILDSHGPKQCAIDAQGNLAGLVTLSVKSIFDEDGRFAPSCDYSDEQSHPADMVIESIGRMTDVSLPGCFIG